MSIEDAYKNDAIRLCSINPLDVLERVCPDLAMAGFSVSDFDVEINVGAMINWKAFAVVRTKSHTEKVSSELFWIRLRNIFRRHELMVDQLQSNVERHAWTERDMHFYAGTDVLFKIEVSPEIDLNVSFL